MSDRAQTPWAFPESRSPRNHFCPGERHHPASHFHPTKDPTGNAAGTPMVLNPPAAVGQETGRKEPPSPYQPREESLHLPALPPPQTPPPFPASLQQCLCCSQRQKGAGGRADREPRAELSWKDPTCLARGLLSTGNHGHVSFELHRLSQAVVSTFLATFRQHT